MTQNYPRRPTTRSRRATVLVADADPSQRQFVGNALRPRGFRVLDVSTGAALLAVARQELPDVVVLSDRLPDGSGVAAAALAEEPATRGVRVVLLCDARP